MTGKNLRRASISLIIDPRQLDPEDEKWPPVVISGPEEIDCLERPPQGKRLIELVYDGLRVVGTLAEESERKIIRVEILEEGIAARSGVHPAGEPSLK